MKNETKEIIRSICTHWICADEEELDRVANELDANIDEIIESKSQKSAIPKPDAMSSVFAFARWLDHYGWKVDSGDGCWFRECEDELTPDISVEYTDQMVWELFLKWCSSNEKSRN